MAAEIAPLRRVGVTVVAEGMAAAASAIYGLVVVNHLTKENYSAYTFLTICLSLLVGLSDLGISRSYYAICGGQSRSATEIRQLCLLLTKLRLRLLVVAALLISGYWWQTTDRMNWNSDEYLVASLLIVGSAVVALNEVAVRTNLALIGNIRALNFGSLAASCVKLAVLLLATTAFSNYGLLIAIAVAPAATALGLHLSLQRAGLLNKEPFELSRERKLQAVRLAHDNIKSQIASSLYYQFQGVATLMLLTIFGTQKSIAEVGALSKLAIAMTIIERVANLFVLPQLTALKSGPALWQRIKFLVSLYVGIALAYLITGWLFPGAWLRLLGDAYQDQRNVLWISFVTTALVSISSFCSSILATKARLSGQWLVIPLTTTAQMLFLAFFDVNTTANALYFSLITATSFASTQAILLGYHSRAIRKSNPD